MTDLSLISTYLNQTIPVFPIIFGTFGNLMNILIFTRRSLRTNPCSNYFLVLSINSLFVLYVPSIACSLSNGWNIDPTRSINILCKLRFFFAFVSLCLVQWLIVLASIDRYLSSCPTLYHRQWSNTSMAQKSILAMIIFIATVYFHVLVWWSSRYNDSFYICPIFDQVYDLFFSIFYIIFICLLSTCLMITFGFKTILNVKRIRSRVALQNNNSRNVCLRSKDRQLIFILLIQVLIGLIFTIPLTIAYIYSATEENLGSNGLNSPKNNYYISITNIARLLNYCNPVSGFYAYTLTSRKFRYELKNIFKRLVTKLYS